MRRLVSEKPLPVRIVRPIFTLPEHDVITDGVGASAELTRAVGGDRTGVDPNVVE
jgi:hypothetical protein